MITEMATRISFKDGESIFSDGEIGNCAYVVQDGSVEIFKKTEDGEVKVGLVEKGGIFGEMALLDDEPRSADARAKRPTTLMKIDRELFKKHVSDCSPFIQGLLRIFCKNSRAMLSDHVTKI